MSAPIAAGEILIVEDDPNDLELTLHALARANVTSPIATARDGVEALDYLFHEGRHADRADGENPRVVLLDLKLPKVDGLQVLERIKSDPRTQRIPVVVLTSSREEPDLRRCYEQGANSYIVKPVDIAQFFQAVAEVGLYWLLLNEPMSQ